MHLQLEPHTIYVAVGPSNCGKSTFFQKLFFATVEQLQRTTITAQPILLSSDQLRKDVLDKVTYLGDAFDKEFDKLSYQSLDLSDLAFKDLFHKIDIYTSYPISAPYIFIDSTGLWEEFRTRIEDLAKERFYNVKYILFLYNKTQDYYNWAGSTEAKRIITKHIAALRETKLPNGRVIKITKPTKEVTVDVSLLNQDCITSSTELDIVGDIHSCYKNLTNIVSALGYDDGLNHPENRQLVFVGDLIDRGPDIEAVLNWFHNRLDLFRENKHFLITGNHERWTKLALKREIDVDTSLLKFFTDFKTLEGSSELSEKFLDVCSAMRPCVISPNSIITHVPCSLQAVGKLSFAACREQSTLRYPDTNEEISELITKFAQTETLRGKIRVFGHISFNEPLVYRGAYGIDTGADKGNLITALKLAQSRKPELVSLPSEYNVGSGDRTYSFNYPQRVLPTLNFDSLSPHQRRRIFNAAKNRINFIAPTISPPAAHEDQLESIASAIDLYTSYGIKDLIIQTKHMGSRCQVYLDRLNPESSFAVSRNGFVINPERVDMSQIYPELNEAIPTVWDDERLTIIDGELMPWSALGKGLIDDVFVSQQIALLEECSDPSTQRLMLLLKTLSEEDKQSYKTDKNSMKRAALAEKWPGHLMRVLDLVGFLPENYDELVTAEAEVYSRQVNIYGSESPVKFMPFTVLKSVHPDHERSGAERPEGAHFSGVLIHTDDPRDVEAANRIFDSCIARGVEGVVVKPYKFDPMKEVDYPTAVKVRQKDYLTLVYGSDYLRPENYSTLLKKKKVASKLRHSVKAQNLAVRLLNMPFGSLTKDNSEYLSLLYQIVCEEASQINIDPKL